jgi:ABC-type lipoprotein export system ATPase subunit
VISIEDLHFRYLEGDFALRIPALEIARGERVAVIGPSGCGKTTLLDLLAGIRLPQQGRIETAGAEVTALDERARRHHRIRQVGLVFQEFELLDYLTVLDNILLPYRVSGALRLDREVRERAAELASEVDIDDLLRRHPDQLSQGERQRVAVCRALLVRPSVLLADEPTGNLDPNNKGRVLDILFGWAERERATLVVVTHDHDLLDRFERLIDFKQFYDLPGAEG